jgi:lactate dehydrogenase-like 2-hydroxyacid dehydrogenase
MKIVVLDKKTLGDDIDVHKGLSFIGELDVFQESDTSKTIERLQNAEIAISNKVVISKDVIDACPKLRLVCVTATGTNNVDLEYAKEKHILVKNVSGYSTSSVAQHTFSLLLSMLNHVEYNNKFVAEGAYSKQSLFTHLGPSIEELNGKTLGIIGLGNIGRKVAEIATAFGMSVVYYSTSGNNLEQDYTNVSLQQLMKRSDILSIHAPLNEKTLNLIGKQEFEQCKKSAILVSMGRGGIINEQALADALLSNQLRGACLDVYEQEPIQKDNPLLNVKLANKILFSPHIAWASQQAREKLWLLTLENINTYLSK